MTIGCLTLTYQNIGVSSILMSILRGTAPAALDLSLVAARLKASREICRNPSIAMLFIQGEIVMRILSKRQVKELVLYSPQHIARLEKAGQFPLRVRLGSNRVGWVEREVLDWLEERLARREIPN
ncbi:MAG: AlpA family phage regulatory protein [Albidovulum sp.]